MSAAAAWAGGNSPSGHAHSAASPVGRPRPQSPKTLTPINAAGMVQAAESLAPLEASSDSPRLNEGAPAAGAAAAGGVFSGQCDEVWLSRRMMTFVEPLEGHFWADQAVRLHWARTRTFAVALLGLLLTWPARTIAQVWDTEFGNDNVVLVIILPFVPSLLGCAVAALIGRTHLWGWLGGGRITPSMRAWLRALALGFWTIAAGSFTLSWSRGARRRASSSRPTRHART